MSLMPYTGWNQSSARSVCSIMDNMERLHTVVVTYPTYRVESVQHIICGIKDNIGQGYSSGHVFHIQGGISPVHYLRLSGQYGKLRFSSQNDDNFFLGCKDFSGRLNNYPPLALFKWRSVKKNDKKLEMEILAYNMNRIPLTLVLA